MNVEEAIKILDKFTTEHKLFNIKHTDGLEEAIETLLTAYEKEKEEHKKECHNCDEYTARLGELETENRMLKSELEKQSKEIEELKEKDDANLAYYDQIYQNGIYTGQKAVEDKIKAKIEEVDKDENASIPDFIEYAKEYATQKLQSLLEKE